MIYRSSWATPVREETPLTRRHGRVCGWREVRMGEHAFGTDGTYGTLDR
jgi:hypothetical protein